MNKYLTLLLVVAAFLLNACAIFPKTGGTPNGGAARATESPSISDRSPLEYANSFVVLSADAQKKELTEINQAIALNKNDLKNRMKAAMIYALPKSRLRDTAKAQTLLDSLLKENTLDDESKILAVILRDYIIEANKLTQKARDDQKRADGSQQKLEALQQEHNALRQKNDTLQKMLDDLKNIEKTMVDRDQGIKK